MPYTCHTMPEKTRKPDNRRVPSEKRQSFAQRIGQVLNTARMRTRRLASAGWQYRGTLGKWLGGVLTIGTLIFAYQDCAQTAEVRAESQYTHSMEQLSHLEEIARSEGDMDRAALYREERKRVALLLAGRIHGLDNPSRSLLKALLWNSGSSKAAETAAVLARLVADSEQHKLLSPDDHTLLGLGLLRLGRFRQARDKFRLSAALGGGSHINALGDAASNLALFEWDAAIASCLTLEEKALEIEPDTLALARILRAIALYGSRRLQEGNRLLASLDRATTSEDYLLLAEGVRAFAHGRHVSGLATLRRLERQLKNMGSGRSLLEMVLCLVRPSETTKGLRLQGVASGDRTQNPLEAVLAAQILYLRGEYSQALDATRAALAADPQYRAALRLHALLLLRTSRFDDLATFLEGLPAQLRTDAFLDAFEVAASRSTRGKLPPSEADRIRIRLRSASSEDRVAWIAALLDGGFYEATVEEATAALEKQRDSQLLYLRGVARLYLQDFAGAYQDLTDAEFLDPGLPDARVHRGALYRILGDAKGALEVLMTVVDQGFRSPELLSNIAACHLDLGEPKKAQTWAVRALELAPNHHLALAVLDYVEDD